MRGEPSQAGHIEKYSWTLTSCDAGTLPKFRSKSRIQKLKLNAQMYYLFFVSITNYTKYMYIPVSCSVHTRAFYVMVHGCKVFKTLTKIYSMFMGLVFLLHMGATLKIHDFLKKVILHPCRPTRIPVWGLPF